MINLEKLKQNFTGDIDGSYDTRMKSSRDASIFEVVPEVVVSPKTVSDVKALVKFASTEKKTDPSIALTPRSGGTDMTGAAIGKSIVVDFTKYLNKIGEIEGRGENRITSQPGAYYRDFEKYTLLQGLIMPAYPASKSICAIGGMLGNNAGGEKSLKYGQVKNYVTQLKMVMADGEENTFKPLNAIELQEKLNQTDFESALYKKTLQLIKQNEQTIKLAKPSTSKNSAGYYLWDVWDGTTFDLTKLLVGSQGTLGIITEGTFKLVPVKKHSELLVIFMHRLDDLAKVIEQIKKHGPDSFELYDDHTLRLAMRFAPDIAKKMGTGTFKLLWQLLPEALMALRGGLPQMVLLAEFCSDSQEQALALAIQAKSAMDTHFRAPTHITKTASESLKYWTIRRESFNLLRQHAHGKISSPFVEDIIVHPEQLSEFLPRLHGIFARYPSFDYTIAGHAGDANFHIIPFVDLKNPHEHELVLRLSNEVYDLIAEFKGSISAEHNDGLAHGAFLNKMYSPEALELFRQIKRIFDPLNIFNPGKKIEATLTDFNKYMRKA